MFGFFVASGEAAELLEFAEATFDAVAQLVQGFVILPLLFTVRARWNHGLGLHGFFYVLNEFVRVITLVCNDCLGLALAQQFDGGGVIADLAACQKKSLRQAQFVDQQMNLRRQSTSGTPQSLVAPFLPPVAACW